MILTGIFLKIILALHRELCYNEKAVCNDDS